ncbi:MAG: hypothetical protein QF363_10105 [Planctomycetaceae bacterium]|jgi:hypothetical protein|nr:hypothetical protein [Planctomycetaceae bacterium]
MYRFTREVVYALLYAAAAVGLVYCCVSSVGRLASVPASSRPMYLVMVSFGTYGAWLCGQTAFEIVQALASGADQGESPPASDGVSD